MHAIPWLVGFAVFGGAAYFLIRVILADRAMGRARTALDQLEDEVRSSFTGGARKYEVPLPDRAEFDLERDVSRDRLPDLQKQLMALANEPLSVKLKGSWVARCDDFARQAREKVRRLQEEAFWAQFAPGSEAAACRFDDKELPLG